MSNKSVNGLWIGGKLSSLELLCIISFLENGHNFVLWSYNPSSLVVPKGVLLKDAREIISEEDVFTYKNKNQFGHGKGSYAGFSDIFRYKLLYEHGGWWADMDITCLKPLDFEAPYVFRTHHDLMVVGNIMKCPPKSELMRRCYEQALAEVDANNRDWHKPIQILNDGIEALGLEQYIVEMSNRDSWPYIRRMILHDIQIPDHWYVLHWVNVEWRRHGINKDYAGKHSVLGRLYQQYDVPLKRLAAFVRFSNRLKLTYGLAVLRYASSWLWGLVSDRMTNSTRNLSSDH